MKRFGRNLMIVAGLATVSAPAIFARNLHDADYGRNGRDLREIVTARREPVRVFDRVVIGRPGIGNEARFCR